MPEKMIAFCGIVCTDCRAFRASQANDAQLKKKVARAWSTKQEMLRPEDIDCDGCLAPGQRLFRFCRTCDVRRCGQERGIENCAYCSEFPCEKLTHLWKHLRLALTLPPKTRPVAVRVPL
jgi:hypothetical protein